MNKLTKNLSEMLEKLPKVNSPNELDQIILSESKRLAPEKSIFQRWSWVPALSTACVVGVAVLVANPLFESSRSPQTSPEGEVQFHTTSKLEKTRTENIESISAPEISAMEMESSALAPAPTPKPAQSRSMNEQMAESAPMETISLQSIDAKELQTKAMADKPEAESVSSGASENIMPDPELIVEEIKRLLENGEREAARALLNQVNRECPECKLPENLDSL